MRRFCLRAAALPCGASQFDIPVPLVWPGAVPRPVRAHCGRARVAQPMAFGLVVARGILLDFHLVKYPAAMQSMHRAGHLAFEALESRGDRLRIFRMPDAGDASLLPCFQG